MTEDKNKYILSIKGMSKSFGRNKVLKHIDLNVKPGTIMGLMGENGAGKSTMMKCLFGTYQKDEGSEFFWAERCTGKWRSDGTPGIEPVSGEKCYRQYVSWSISKKLFWSC